MNTIFLIALGLLFVIGSVIAVLLISLKRKIEGGEPRGIKQEIDFTRAEEAYKSFSTQIEKVSVLVRELEKDREGKFTALTEQIKEAREQTDKLSVTTQQLREVLTSRHARGQWGQRLADDILKHFGFVEGVNYTKQETSDTTGKRPDYTFLLPDNLKLNMDVKFPLDNYSKYFEATAEDERKKYTDLFLKDVKAHIKEIATRDYINPEDNTVEAVLMFIPNESIFVFINENYENVIDDSLKMKVVICSPVTLFAILAVIRQAVDNFVMEQSSRDLLKVMAKFDKQWEEYTKTFGDLGKKIDAVRKEYDELTTTRQKKLDVPLKEIAGLRRKAELPEAGVADFALNEAVVKPDNDDS
jgi:DNA recombination protein RmuC